MKTRLQFSLRTCLLIMGAVCVLLSTGLMIWPIFFLALLMLGYLTVEFVVIEFLRRTGSNWVAIVRDQRLNSKNSLKPAPDSGR